MTKQGAILCCTVLAIATLLGSSPWPILAQSQGIQPASSSFVANPQQQPQDKAEQPTAVNDTPEMVLLSSRFNEQNLGDEIVGEVMNNSTESAEYVEVLATFRDGSGAVIDTALGYADAHLIIAEASAPFKILLTSDMIEDEAVTYDLTLKWRDLDFEEFSKDVLTRQPLSGSGNNNDINADNDNDKNDDNYDNDDDDGYGCDSNLECQLSGNREWAKDHIGNFDELNEEDQESAIKEVLNDVDEDYLDAHEENEEDNENSDDDDEEGQEKQEN